MVIMNTHGKTDEEGAGDVAKNNFGKALYRLLIRYGVEKAKTIMTEVRNSILKHSSDEGTFPDLEDETLEVMYRDYVASGASRPITFIEYKSLAVVITALAED
jgi:hypothetical protein